MVGDEQGVEAEILNGAGKLLDAPRALQAVSLPDVRGQEDAEPSDITHAALSSLLPERPIVDGSPPAVVRLAIGKECRGALDQSSVAKIRSEASSSAANPASRSRSMAASTSRFASRTASGPRLAISSAISL